MKKMDLRTARKAALAIAEFTGSPCKVLDWRDSSEGIRLVPDEDPYWIAMQDMEDIPGMPAGTYVEVGYGSLGIYHI